MDDVNVVGMESNNVMAKYFIPVALPRIDQIHHPFEAGLQYLGR
jgi:hypothetical protein